MSEAFVAFVRFEEKLLMLKRSNTAADFSGMWDGVWGSGSGTDPEEVITRVSECTGIPTEALVYHGHGPDRGIVMDSGSLVDVVPVLVVSATEDVEPAGIYTHAEWVDPGKIQEYTCIFSNLDMDNSHKLFREMYGSVGSFLYIVKTAINSEIRVVDEMGARLTGSGSLTDLDEEIMSILHPTGMRGYVFVEASALHHVEKLIGRSGGRDPSSRRGVNQTPLKNAKSVLPGEAPLEDILPYLEPKSVTHGIEIGCIVEIISGAFKGEKARVLSVQDTKNEVSLDLYENPIPMTISMSGDHVRVYERVDG